MSSLYITSNLFKSVLGTTKITLIINIILISIVLIILFRISEIFLNRKIKITSERTFLEVTPHGKELLSLTKLASLIKALSTSRSLSYEIYSTRTSGITFVVSCPKDLKDSVTKKLMSLSSAFKIKEINDYMNGVKSDNHNEVVELELSSDYYFPLNVDNQNEDLSTYFRGAMSNLRSNEVMAIQFIATKVMVASKDRSLKQLNINNKVRRFNAPLPVRVPIKLSSYLFKLPKSIYKVIKLVLLEDTDRFYVLGSKRKIRKLSLEDSRIVKTKLVDQLERTTIRLFVSTKSAKRTKQLVEALSDGLNLFNNENQSLVKKRHTRRLLSSYRYRVESLRLLNNNYLSSMELASLFNFSSFSEKTLVEHSKSYGRVLPLPVAFKKRSKFSVTLGLNDYQGYSNPIGLSEDERQRHLYITGGTGSGKTTLLKYMIKQDIKSGRGIALIDPHGDLAESIINEVPKSRLKDVIYFNPCDISHPIVLNILETSLDLKGDEKLLEQDLITEQLVSIFRKLFSKNESGGNRLEHIVRNAVETAFLVPDATIFTVYRLLTDDKYRNDIISKISDKSLISFWNNEYNSAGSMQRVKLSIGITSKIGRFLRSTVTRRMLGHPTSTISFDDIINNNKILICNLSKGLIGEDNSQLIGTLVMAKFQIASYKRARMKESDRKDFYLYIDEFQNFATSSFLQMLSEGRKYHLLLTIAEQSPSQQDVKYISNILANVGNVITFRSNSPLDEKLLLPIYSPFITEGEILNLPAFNFYIKVAAKYVKEPTSGVTIKQKESSLGSYKRVVASSRKKYSYAKS
jgi:DNA helicase HerA-like ATPase